MAGGGAGGGEGHLVCIILTHCVRKPICDSSLKQLKTELISNFLSQIETWNCIFDTISRTTCSSKIEDKTNVTLLQSPLSQLLLHANTTHPPTIKVLQTAKAAKLGPVSLPSMVFKKKLIYTLLCSERIVELCSQTLLC